MDERLRFVARLLDGEAMSELCREFGISRKTGYKIFDRYKEHGLEALTDRSRRPVRYANQLPPPDREPDRQPQAREAALGRPQDPRAAGAAAAPATCASRPRAPSTPSSTATAWSNARASRRTPRHRHAAVAGRSRPTICGAPTSRASSSSATAATATRSPSPTTPRATCCCARPSNRPARTSPSPPSSSSSTSAACRSAIRSDNGVPFASPNGLFNLSKLAVWWLRLGIAIERIKPGHPQQNGRHERMHLTLKKEATRPPGMNSLQQQARFDAFVDEFNTERPHEALAMKRPAEVYTPSPRPYHGLPDIDYPFHDRDVLVTACGRICMHRKKINISTVLAGQRLGIKEVDDGIWLVSFMRLRSRLYRPGAENLANQRSSRH